MFEYHITIQDEDFNLGILTMKTPEGTFEADRILLYSSVWLLYDFVFS